jgi:hypothetical protein
MASRYAITFAVSLRRTCARNEDRGVVTIKRWPGLRAGLYVRVNIGQALVDKECCLV